VTPSIWADKVQKYLLNPNHPVGGPKCRLFLQFGFAIDRPEVLVASLFVHLNEGTRETVASRFGDRIVCRGPLQTPAGETPFAISVWSVDDREKQEFSLITAYITDLPKIEETPISF